MFDWNWLWVVGEIGVTYGFYRWWKADDKFTAILEVAPDIDINDLQKYSSNKSIDYAIVHGIVQADGTKSNSVFKSKFAPHTLGVIQRITVQEKKLEKFRTVWAETHKVLSDATRFVPFRLTSPIGNYIRIEKPLAFSSVDDALDVTHLKFEPNKSSSLEKIVDSLLGDVTTGIETKEKMLLIDVPLTGVGHLKQQSNDIWHLIPHEKWGGILTRLSRSEILDEYRSRTTIARFLTICFGLITLGTTSYLLYKYYSRRQQVPEVVPNALPNTDIVDNDTNVRVHCVICLQNEVVYNLQPCGHLGLCHTCAVTLQTAHANEQLCPLCRTHITLYQRIFMP